MAKFHPFAIERLIAKWENVVDYDLSESGVLPATLRELVDDPAQLDELLDVRLGYPQTNGIDELRELIAALYPGAASDNVLVTVGAAEANYLALSTVVQPGDELVVMLPNYMQIWGIAQNRGLRPTPFHLREEHGWKPDLDELAEVVTDRTKLIAICNPSNPTGYILTAGEMDAIVAVAARVGAWLLADEVYSGTELDTDEQTPTFYGRYDRVLAMNSLSKAYGLPGLRIGWTVAPAQAVEDFWARHDYTTIGTTMLGNRLAARALSPAVRPRLIARARGLVRNGLPVLRRWLERRAGDFELVPPQASPIAFVRYHLGINSTALVERCIREQSVLMVPGDHFGMDGHLRLRHGLPPDYLQAGLDRFGAVLDGLGGAPGS
ncbi:MAG: aminotransferase class I/II-fold pyridoxal phosphate-dependent enzyme [bacterium]